MAGSRPRSIRISARNADAAADKAGPIAAAVAAVAIGPQVGAVAAAR